MSIIEERLKEMGITLPESVAPMANYVSSVKVDDMVYTSGVVCIVNGKPLYTGRLGQDLTVEQGYEAARVTMINLLSVLKKEIGDLDLVERVVKVLGFVNSSIDFYQQPQVINGASDLLVEVFGDKGRHARSAVGTSVLPMNIPIEIEMIVKIKK